MKKYDICVIRGDGIGGEIIDETIRVLDVVSDKFGFELNYTDCIMGGEAIDVFNTPLPDETLQIALESDAVLLGAIGGSKWESLPKNKQPLEGLTRLFSSLEVYANLKPIFIFDELINASSIKAEVIKEIDILLVRDLSGGIYFGEPREKSRDVAFNTMVYTKSEIKRVAKLAFESSFRRKKKLTLVDRADFLEVSLLWRETIEEMREEYPEIDVESIYIDEAVKLLLIEPNRFDVILTDNMFGDILNAQISAITGISGLLPSANLGDKIGIFKPYHSSAFDIAKQGIANPIGMILSAALMLEYALDQKEAANVIKRSVKNIIKKGYRTKDIGNLGSVVEVCTTSEIATAICEDIMEGE